MNIEVHAGLSLVASTPSSRRPVSCCSPLSAPLSTALSSLLPCFRSPRDPKSTEREKKERKKAARFNCSRTPRPSGLTQSPSFPASSVAAPIWNSRDGDGLRIFAQGHRQQLRRPCRVSQCSALPGPSRLFSPFLHLLVFF